jgi:hypothetical protein
MWPCDAATAAEAGTMRDPQVRLTEEERRRLDELEAALREEDPRLARRLQSARRVPLVGVVLSARPPARGPIGALLVVIGAVLTIATLTISLPLSIAGTLMMAFGGYFALTATVVRLRLRQFEAWLGRASHPAENEL